jgi:hypothetical protein
VKYPVHRCGVTQISVRNGLPWMRTWSYRERGSVSAGIACGRRRIDYFPDPHAVATIDSLRTRYAGGDASSVINRSRRRETRAFSPRISGVSGCSRESSLKALSVHPMCLCDWRFCGSDKCR